MEVGSFVYSYFRYNIVLCCAVVMLNCVACFTIYIVVCVCFVIHAGSGVEK